MVPRKVCAEAAAQKYTAASKAKNRNSNLLLGTHPIIRCSCELFVFIHPPTFLSRRHPGRQKPPRSETCAKYVSRGAAKGQAGSAAGSAGSLPIDNGVLAG